MSDRKKAFGRELEEIISAILRPRGFRKQGRYWHRLEPEFIDAFHLSASQWGPQFYLYAGVYIRALGAQERPRYNHLHMSVMISGEAAIQAMDGEDASFDPASRMAILDSTIQDGLTYMQEMRDLRMVIRLFDEQKLRGILLVNAQEYIRRRFPENERQTPSA
jgi:hypothetical protein